MSLGYALRQRSVLRTLPFTHWEIERPLTASARQEVIDAFAPHTSWSDSGQLLDGEIVAMPPCCSIIRDNVSHFPAIGAVIDELLSRSTIERIESMLSQSMEGGFLKLDLFRDSQTLWCDLRSTIQDEMKAMLISVNPHAPDRPTRSMDRDATQCETDAFAWRDNVGYMLTSAVELTEDLFAVERNWLHISYIREATDWKLPPRRAIKSA